MIADVAELALPLLGTSWCSTSHVASVVSRLLLVESDSRGLELALLEGDGGAGISLVVAGGDDCGGSGTLKPDSGEGGAGGSLGIDVRPGNLGGSSSITSSIGVIVGTWDHAPIGGLCSVVRGTFLDGFVFIISSKGLSFVFPFFAMMNVL